MIKNYYIPSPHQVYDALEVCAGSALLSRCLRYGQGLSVGAFDIMDWESYAVPRGIPGNKNPLDLTTAAGMGSLGFCTRKLS